MMVPRGTSMPEPLTTVVGSTVRSASLFASLRTSAAEIAVGGGGPPAPYVQPAPWRQMRRP